MSDVPTRAASCGARTIPVSVRSTLTVDRGSPTHTTGRGSEPITDADSWVDPTSRPASPAAAARVREARGSGAPASQASSSRYHPSSLEERQRQRRRQRRALVRSSYTFLSVYLFFSTLLLYTLLWSCLCWRSSRAPCTITILLPQF